MHYHQLILQHYFLHFTCICWGVRCVFWGDPYKLDLHLKTLYTVLGKLFFLFSLFFFLSGSLDFSANHVYYQMRVVPLLLTEPPHIHPNETWTCEFYNIVIIIIGLARSSKVQVTARQFRQSHPHRLDGEGKGRERATTSIQEGLCDNGGGWGGKVYVYGDTRKGFGRYTMSYASGETHSCQWVSPHSFLLPGPTSSINNISL